MNHFRSDLIYDFTFGGKTYYLHPYTCKTQNALLLAETDKNINSRVKTLVDGILYPIFHSPGKEVKNLLYADSNFFWQALFTARINSHGSTNNIQAFPCPHCKSRANIVVVEMSPVPVEGKPETIKMKNDMEICFGQNLRHHFEKPDLLGGEEHSKSKSLGLMIEQIAYGISCWDESPEKNRRFIEDNFTGDTLNELLELYGKRNIFKVKLNFWSEDHKPAECFECHKAFHSEEISSAHQLMKLVNQGDSLMNYYETTFHLMKVHDFSLFEVQSLLPYELELYMGLLSKHEAKLKELKDAEEKRFKK